MFWRERKDLNDWAVVNGGKLEQRIVVPSRDAGAMLTMVDNGCKLSKDNIRGNLLNRERAPVEKELREFLNRYVGQGESKKDKVLEEDVEMLVAFAVSRHVEKDILDYGNAHPDAPFWNLLRLIPNDLEDYADDQ